MNNILVNRLFDSFIELEKAVLTARKALENKSNVPQEVHDRIKYYEEMVAKQRSLAISMCRHLGRGNWSEVSRHMRLINGLSAMIRDDARDIIQSTSAPREIEHRESPEVIVI